MKSLTHHLLAAAVGVTPFLGMPLITGCEHDHVAVYHDHADGYAYAPGYYYAPPPPPVYYAPPPPVYYAPPPPPVYYAPAPAISLQFRL